jgi:phosphoribosylglycinamide formyltransferase-1
MKPRWAFFISGQGSNMSALLDQKENIDIAVVVSSSADAVGVCRARRAGVPVVILDKKIVWSEVLQTLQLHRVSHIFLLGFMKIVPVEFLEQWSGVILNVHPSLLPEFPGLKSIERAFAEKKNIGATVHHVNADVDGGNIILQKTAVVSSKVPSLDLATCTERVHWCEYTLVRQAVERHYA